MLVPTAVMGALAIALLLVGYYRGQGQHIVGVKSALNMTIEILPLLAFAFIVAGMVQVLLPREL
ncbi:MAG: permease, partial [Deltaproteobacteria bacterium]